MKTPTTLLLITALTSAVNAQLQSLNSIEGPIAGRLWTAPAVAATELVPPLPFNLGEPGELIGVGALPEPRCQAGQGGRPVCLLRLISPGAKAYRLHFESLHLATGSLMYVYGLDAAGQPTTVFGPYEDDGPNADGAFRSRIVPGVAAVVEIQGEIKGAWPFTLERIGRIDAATLQQLRDSDDPGLRETEAERKAPPRELHPCSWRGRATYCEAVNGVLLYQGDMIADPPDAANSGKRSERFSIGVSGASFRWRQARIPYRVDDSLIRQVGQWRLIDAEVATAILYWNSLFPGLFVAWTNEADYVTIRRVDTGCYASVAGRDGGEQFVSLATSCSAGSIVHELGHVIGLHHEQTREDRDNFVQIVWSNILDGKAPQFEQDNDERQDIGAYDYGSIMHYGSRAFSNGNGDGRTIIALQPLPAGVRMGQRDGLSAGDIAGATFQLCGREAYTVPSPVDMAAIGGRRVINVAAPSFCPGWTAAGDIVTAGFGPTVGNGTVTIDVPQNHGPLTVFYTITIARKSVQVRVAPGRDRVDPEPRR